MPTCGFLYVTFLRRARRRVTSDKRAALVGVRHRDGPAKQKRRPFREPANILLRPRVDENTDGSGSQYHTGRSINNVFVCKYLAVSIVCPQLWRKQIQLAFSLKRTRRDGVCVLFPLTGLSHTSANTAGAGSAERAPSLFNTRSFLFSVGGVQFILSRLAQSLCSAACMSCFFLHRRVGRQTVRQVCL